MSTSEYEKQAQAFLKKTKTKMEVKFMRYGFHFSDDEKSGEKRDIYRVTFTRGDRVFSVEFGQSINDSGVKLKRKDGEVWRHFKGEDVETIRRLQNKYEKAFNFRYAMQHNFQIKLNLTDEVIFYEEPTAYSVLACLQKYDVGSYENFCEEFGYSEDSRKAEKTYKAVLEEWCNVERLWSDEEIEQLQEIN